MANMCKEVSYYILGSCWRRGCALSGMAHKRISFLYIEPYVYIHTHTHTSKTLFVLSSNFFCRNLFLPIVLLCSTCLVDGWAQTCLADLSPQDSTLLSNIIEVEPLPSFTHEDGQRRHAFYILTCHGLRFECSSLSKVQVYIFSGRSCYCC